MDSEFSNDMIIDIPDETVIFEHSSSENSEIFEIAKIAEEEPQKQIQDETPIFEEFIYIELPHEDNTAGTMLHYIRD